MRDQIDLLQGATARNAKLPALGPGSAREPKSL
jgi:hypothetical protein